ncbi:MAG: F0F1 ATP synthase subunit epsilon [Elusimicrobia bacterium]|nr:F0F1 ATP synthase subunit epsilon [Elusimicrobiota bacterium]
MGHLSVEIISPERLVKEVQGVEFVALPGYEGELGVLAGHAPFLLELKAGEVRIRGAQGTESFVVSGGFAEIFQNKVSIFAETAEVEKEIDVERARQAMQRAQTEMRSRKLSPVELAQLEAALKRAAVRLKVADLRRKKIR